MDSTDAQYAKMQMFTQPVRCASTAELGAELDKWGDLGTQIGKPTDEDFKLIALKELVPKSIHDFMGTQVLLRKYPEAIACVRRQVTVQCHASQVAQVQRQGRHGLTPMDFGAVTNNPLAQLLAAIERVTKAPEASEATGTQGEETEWDSGTASRVRWTRSSRRSRGRARARRARSSPPRPALASSAARRATSRPTAEAQ